MCKEAGTGLKGLYVACKSLGRQEVREFSVRTLPYSEDACLGEQSRESPASAAGFWFDVNTVFLKISFADVGSELAVFTRHIRRLRYLHVQHTLGQLNSPQNS